jgi:hypothetical protein
MIGVTVDKPEHFLTFMAAKWGDIGFSIERRREQHQSRVAVTLLAQLANIHIAPTQATQHV